LNDDGAILESHAP